MIIKGTTAHYSDIIMSTMASQITGVWIDYTNLCSGADKRKHQSSPSLAFVRGNHRSPVDYPHKGPATRNMFPFDDVTMSDDKVSIITRFSAVYNREPKTMHSIHLRNMHKDSALSCCGACRFYPYPSGLLHCRWGNPMIAPMPVKQQ